MKISLIIILLFMATLEGNSQSNNKEVAILGAGCFWCVEAVFEELRGVELVESGYTGGSVINPTYAQIGTGNTGHAEVARITFNPAVVTFKEVLEVFWKTHDPTTLNRQGADVGTQYRSAVFYLDASQKEAAEHYKKRLNESGAYSAPVITEITKAGKYYPAENYHQDYFALNPEQGYCRYVIQPKLEKFRAAFADKLKK
jgi:peptide-methionine (S)-S-oxide reductase